VGEALYGWTLIQVSEDGALFDTGGTTRRVYVGEISVAKQASPVAEVEEAPLAASSPVMSSDAATAVKSEPSPGGWTRRHIERARAEQRLARELPLILSETGLTPRVEDGVVRGLRITRLPDGTILSEAGLLPGDVLIRIDDTPVDSTRALVGLYRQVSSEDEIRVVVERRGQILKLAYAID
jgi:type II secretory pathway component PulC